MAARPTVQVNVPLPPQKQMTLLENCVPGFKPFPVDKALQFTPFVQSVLPVLDRIEIPEPSRARENGRIATSAERAYARQVIQQQNMSATAQNHLTNLLNREGLVSL